MNRRTSAEQAAYDAGEGRRCISHHRSNPYCPTSQTKLHAAYEEGFARLNARLAPGMTDLMVPPESIPTDLGKGDPLVDPKCSHASSRNPNNG